MIKRELERWLNQNKENPQIIQVQGLRQTGKTTLMKQYRSIFTESLHYPLYQLPLLQRYRREPERLILEVERKLQQMEKGKIPLHVFIDEIQKIPLLYQGLQGLYDTYKSKIKFWIWGSSARPIKREKAETLAGRVFTKILWPFSQSEILKKRSIVPLLINPKEFLSMENLEPLDYISRLEKYFTQSLLPEPFLMESRDKSDPLLESYQSTYIENEIRRENLVQDIGVFERFLTLAAAEDGRVVNYSSKGKVLGISPVTVQNYYYILEDTFICKTLPAYSKSLRVQFSKSPKIYFTDAGLARFLSGKRGVPLHGVEEFGNAFESWVISELFKQIEYQSLPWRCSYLRTKTGVEVDLILQTPDRTVACEIKSAKKIDRQHCKDLQKIFQLDPQISYGLIISLDPRCEEVAPKIYNIPAWML